jgi:hypothetical protein
MSIQIIDVEITGRTEMMHRSFLGIDKKYPPNPPEGFYTEDAEEHIYRNDEGRICVPAEHIKAAIVKAGVQFKYKGRKTYMDFINGGVYIKPFYMPLINSKNKEAEWVTDIRRVCLNGKSSILRGRAKFADWKIRFQMECIDATITPNIIQEILTYAGKYLGISEARKIGYGRYDVTSFQVQK